MKHLLLAASLFSFVHLASAAEVEKMYYVGEARLSSATGQSHGSQAFQLEKIHDPDASTIIEHAVVVKPDQTVEEHTMTLKVKGDAFTISDASNTVSGAGTLFGPAWHWTYFKATYESKNGARIVDENFMTDPAVLVVRKKISAPDGTLNSVTPAAFNILSASLLKKAAAKGGEKKP